ncbi:TraB domain-containing protein [Natrarchaeobaculum aegyptiacum]|uniref:Conjugal transfer protein TraB n=1 Tax=Natrarchaeobaculum aegyptiacum TaxID=745377 RepID=A0A2Z2I063_9EURY|nr:TraB domain-containing protein [Natrarchaeobaculum aegyptiacum]ARS90854.1 hypothetical protein B1756_14725 [Natrarchaeobaculum aegyptiacum]
MSGSDSDPEAGSDAADERGSITFVPSVHFSPVHRRRVRRTIREVDPDVVAVELDARRYDRIERSIDGGALDLARDLPPPTALTYRLLRTIQRTVVRLFGLDPELTDMEVAIETAAERGHEVALIDDPLEDTVASLTRRVGIDTIPKLLMRASRLGPEEQARALEMTSLPFRDVRSGDDVQPAIDQMRRLLPEVAEVLVDRRDRSMARRLHALRNEGVDVVAVIGAGHHNGIRDHLERLERLDRTGDTTSAEGIGGSDAASETAVGEEPRDRLDSGVPVGSGDTDVVDEPLDVADLEGVTVPRRRPTRDVTTIPIE